MWVESDDEEEEIENDDKAEIEEAKQEEDSGTQDSSQSVAQIARLTWLKSLHKRLLHRM